MQFFFEFFHVFLCLVLILIILLQPGKDSADIFGGGQGGNRMYGSRSQQSPLGRVTTIVAVLFMVTSITLALYSSKRAQAKSEILDKVEEMEQQDYITYDLGKDLQNISFMIDMLREEIKDEQKI